MRFLFYFDADSNVRVEARSLATSLFGRIGRDARDPLLPPIVAELAGSNRQMFLRNPLQYQMKMYS